jgi:class 3 adenylate cyclase
VCRQLPPSFETIDHGEIRIKGKEHPVPVWEIRRETSPGVEEK